MNIEHSELPFRHWVIDGALSDAIVSNVARDVRHSHPLDAWNVHPRWIEYDGSNERGKRTTREVHCFGPDTMWLFHYLASQDWIGKLEDVTGIHSLIPDPILHGGGVHSTGRGGWLGVHLDYALHPVLRLERRVNLILFLNQTWQEEWGGQLEFWDATATGCVTAIEPNFNRIALWETSDVSYHGHPTPLMCPVEVRRDTIAMTYLTVPRGPLTRTRALFVPTRNQ